MKNRLIQAALGAVSAALVSFIGSLLNADPSAVIAVSTPVGAAVAVKADAISALVRSADLHV